MSVYLRTEKGHILNPFNDPVYLRGVNLGGWLMMEAYFMHAPNVGERVFRKNFTKALGSRAMNEFDQKFRGAFVTEADFKNVAQLGFNCVRVPFHYRLVERKPYRMDKDGIRYLDKVLQWAQKYKVYVILDLHAAPGAQNQDWHGDSTGKARLWTKKDNQERTFAIWEKLADRYKNKKYLAGYDLLNESVVKDDRKLNRFYKELIKRIRAIDRNHILFVEGNHWATDLKCLDDIEDDNYCLSVHTYEPLEFTFNFHPHLSYPSSSKKRVWNALTIREHLIQYHQIENSRYFSDLVANQSSLIYQSFSVYYAQPKPY